MHYKHTISLSIGLLCLLPNFAAAREWSDATGQHKFEGDMIAASAQTIVVRGKRGALEAYIVDQLSEADQKFVAEYLSSENDNPDPKKMQTWTSRDGLRFRGRVTGYGSKDVALSYVGGTVRVNNKPFHEIDQIYQQMIPKIVAEYDDKSVTSEKELRLWSRKLRGKEKLFTVNGVMMWLENREEIAIPLFLFSDEERAVLEDGWEIWNATSEKERQEEQERESFLAEASAAEYQRNLEANAKARTNQQIQLMQLGMMAVNAGVTNLWEVQLLPRPGVRARPMVVVIPAVNSGQASALAVQKYPGFVSGAVRQMNN